MKLSNTKRKRALINYRNLKSLSISDFSSDIVNSHSNCNLNLDNVNSSILNLLDICSPIRTFLVTIHDNCPWFNSELHTIKRHLRKLENLYKIKSSNETYTSFVNYRYFYRSPILITKQIYYYNTFSSFENNTRNIYSFINSLTKTDSVIFPTVPTSILCSNFSIFFRIKFQILFLKLSL